jgi:hypothetical protein
MVPVEAAVNSSMLLTISLLDGALVTPCLAGVVRNPARIRQLVQRNKRCVQMHNSPKRAISCCHPAIALRSPDRSRQESPGKAPSR